MSAPGSDDYVLFPSMPLSDVIGVDPGTKLQILCRILTYSEDHRLFDPLNSLIVRLDDKLKGIFVRDCMSISEIEDAIMLHVV